MLRPFFVSPRILFAQDHQARDDVTASTTQTRRGSILALSKHEEQVVSVLLTIVSSCK